MSVHSKIKMPQFRFNFPDPNLHNVSMDENEFNEVQRAYKQATKNVKAYEKRYYLEKMEQFEVREIVLVKTGEINLCQSLDPNNPVYKYKMAVIGGKRINNVMIYKGASAINADEYCKVHIKDVEKHPIQESALKIQYYWTCYRQNIYEKKLEKAKKRNRSAWIIQDAFKRFKIINFHKKLLACQFKIILRNRSARIIQRCFKRYKAREYLEDYKEWIYDEDEERDPSILRRFNEMAFRIQHAFKRYRERKFRPLMIEFCKKYGHHFEDFSHLL